MDVEGLEDLISRIEEQSLRVVGRDLTSPSPLAQEILSARPYAFLDDAPAEERRTLAVQSRRYMSVESAAELGRLDSEAIDRVRAEAWPAPGDADELHDALLISGCWCEDEGLGRGDPTGAGLDRSLMFEQLIAERRATRLFLPDHPVLWVATERAAQWLVLRPDGRFEPSVPADFGGAKISVTEQTAMVELVRGRLEVCGPVTADRLQATVPLSRTQMATALATLEAEGFAMQGRFDGGGQIQWCDRRLLSRIHRYTLGRLRKEIEPVSVADFMRFVLDWHGLGQSDRPEGPDALAAVLEKLEGFEAPAAAWEPMILKPRLRHDDQTRWLDALCLGGRVCWGRLSRRVHSGDAPRSPVKTAPMATYRRRQTGFWHRLSGPDTTGTEGLSAEARRLYETLTDLGPSFREDLAEASGLLPAQVQSGLKQLAAAGLATADGFAGLRGLLGASDARRKRRRPGPTAAAEAGRWSKLPPRSKGQDEPRADEADAMKTAWVLLRRYGVVFRGLMAREADWLPPWRLILRALRRLEARGEIRGGRPAIRIRSRHEKPWPKRWKACDEHARNGETVGWFRSQRPIR